MAGQSLPHMQARAHMWRHNKRARPDTTANHLAILNERAVCAAMRQRMASGEAICAARVTMYWV